MDIEKHQEGSTIYRSCVAEMKFRISHVERMLKALPDNDTPENYVLISEVVALQFRKIIELIGLASIAANRENYEQIREHFYKDWNARYIFRDIERINQRFYPVPIEGLSPAEYEGGPEIIEEYDDHLYLNKEAALRLYDKCSSILHADNRYGSPINYKETLEYFDTQIVLFKTLLGNFWVYLVPDNKAYCVWTYFGMNKEVDVALAQFG